MSDIAIIGSGISGLAAGQILSKAHSVQLFDQAPGPGGLVRCERVQDNLFHRVGGHVFNSRNPEVLDWFWGFFDRDTEFLKARRNAKILMNGKYIGYPLENYLHQLEKGLVSKILDDFLSPNYLPRDPFSYPNFEAFLISNFGKTLYEFYFKPYNEKIWNSDLSGIPLGWLEGKLPMPNLKDMLLSNIVVQEESEMVHATFYYAKEGGSQFIADRLAQGLKIHSNTTVAGIRKEGDRYPIGNGRFQKVVYTGDVRKLDLAFPESPAAKTLAAQVRNLPSNGTSNVFCETDPGDISWLYLPGPEVKAHRIIYTGTFAPSNNRGSDRHTCVVEFSGKHNPEDMYGQLNRLPGNLKPLAWNCEPNSYIIHLPDTRATIDAARKALEAEGIYLLGRFAEWEYYNMDKAIEAAMALAKQLSPNA